MLNGFIGVGINLVIWTTLEANIGIFAANLPALGFLRKKMEEKLASAPALRYLRFLSSGKSAGDSDREMLPTIGAANPRRKRDAFDSVLGSDDGLMGEDERELGVDRNAYTP